MQTSIVEVGAVAENVRRGGLRRAGTDLRAEGETLDSAEWPGRNPVAKDIVGERPDSMSLRGRRGAGSIQVTARDTRGFRAVQTQGKAGCRGAPLGRSCHDHFCHGLSCHDI
jgi:hypothetical protein